VAKEREKRRLVIASILKPVDDTRMLEKMGATLAAQPHLDVTIIGYPAAGAAHPRIRQVALSPFPRLSAQRWLARWIVLREAWRRKPHVFIFTTHELIVPALVLKIVFNTRILYDVRENYYRNILFSESLPALLRLPLALLVRFKEKLAAPAIDHFFLAEKGYEQEIRFHRGGWTVLENKALIPANRYTRKRQEGKIRLLFSGTLAESTGVFRAIQLAHDLFQLDPGVTLTIAGYAATGSLRERIRTATQHLPFIRLVGIDHLVPHTRVVELIFESDAGILAYSDAGHTRNARPTKLFEYLQASLPIILEDRWPWMEHFEKSHPFALFDFGHPNPLALLNTLQTKPFYPEPVLDAGWESEAPRLLEAIKIV